MILVRGYIKQKFTHQKLLKIFEKLIKNLHKTFKIIQNFSKIKFNTVEFKKFKHSIKFKKKIVKI